VLFDILGDESGDLTGFLGVRACETAVRCFLFVWFFFLGGTRL
jgi:hypothetical protein